MAYVAREVLHEGVQLLAFCTFDANGCRGNAGASAGMGGLVSGRNSGKYTRRTLSRVARVEWPMWRDLWGFGCREIAATPSKCFVFWLARKMEQVSRKGRRLRVDCLVVYFSVDGMHSFNITAVGSDLCNI